MRPLISLCIIAKNEEQTLPACLQAVAPQVDEIIIVDTGSTDDTKTIAARFGASIVEYVWQDNFAQARNIGIEQCTGDYILVLDADEVIEEQAREKLITFCNLYPDQCGSLTITSPYTNDGKALIKSAEVRRFFPNGADYYFKGRIHEQLCFKGTPASYIATEVNVHHSGYDLEAATAEIKFERNRILLEKAIKEAPNDCYLMFQLGRTYLGMKNYEQAAVWLQQAIELTPITYRHYASAVIDYGYALKGMGCYDQALDHCVQQLQIMSDFPDLYLLLAFVLMEQGKPETIETMLACFEKCLALDGSTIVYETVHGATTFLPNYHIGLFFELMGDQSSANSYYSEAAKHSFEPALAALKRLG